MIVLFGREPQPNARGNDLALRDTRFSPLKMAINQLADCRVEIDSRLVICSRAASERRSWNRWTGLATYRCWQDEEIRRPPVSWLLLLWLAKETQFKLASRARMTRSAFSAKLSGRTHPSGTPGDEDERIRISPKLVADHLGLDSSLV